MARAAATSSGISWAIHMGSHRLLNDSAWFNKTAFRSPRLGLSGNSRVIFFETPASGTSTSRSVKFSRHRASTFAISHRAIRCVNHPNWGGQTPTRPAVLSGRFTSKRLGQPHDPARAEVHLLNCRRKVFPITLDFPEALAERRRRHPVHQSTGHLRGSQHHQALTIGRGDPIENRQSFGRDRFAVGDLRSAAHPPLPLK